MNENILGEPPQLEPLVNIVSAEPVTDTVVHFVFTDGLEGDVDLTEIMYEPTYENILETGELMNFITHTEKGTVEWVNHEDVAPEILWLKAAHIPRDF